MNESEKFIGKNVQVVVERPIGSCHPKFNEMKYEVNYGYIPDTLSGDGEELDAYILGEEKELKKFKGVCIAVIRRLKESDDKLIVVSEGKMFDDRTIRKLTDFQERYFESEIIR